MEKRRSARIEKPASSPSSGRFTGTIYCFSRRSDRRGHFDAGGLLTRFAACRKPPGAIRTVLSVCGAQCACGTGHGADAGAGRHRGSELSLIILNCNEAVIRRTNAWSSLVPGCMTPSKILAAMQAPVVAIPTGNLG